MVVVTGDLTVRSAFGQKAATTNGATPMHVTQRQTFSITLDASFEWGNFADGPAFIVVNDATPDITSRTPAATTIGGDAANGAMLNHLIGTNQAYDERAEVETFTGYGSPASLPQTVESGDVFTVALSTTATIADSADARDGVPEEYGSFFFVSEVPLEGALSPAGMTWQGRGWLEYYYIDLDAKIAALPDYDTSGFSNLPDFTTLYDRMRVYCPILAGDDDTFNPFHYRATLPRSIVSGQNTGKNICQTVNDACLVLISSSYTAAQKKQMAIALCSFGLQCGEPYFSNNLPIEPNGQHCQFQFTPWALAMSWLGRTDDIETAYGYSGNFLQAFQFTQGLLDQCDPGHTNMAWPYTYRRRNLNSISGNDVTVQADLGVGSDGDNPRTRLTGMLMTDGTNTSEVTGQTDENIFLSSGDSGTITVEDASGFTVDTDVWFLPQVEPVLNDYEWTTAGLSTFAWYNPNTTATYRREAFWSGQVLLLKALGINSNGVLDPVFGYVQRCNSGNEPSPSWSFADHHTTAFEEEFWDAHASTIFA